MEPPVNPACDPGSLSKEGPQTEKKGYPSSGGVFSTPPTKGVFFGPVPMGGLKQRPLCLSRRLAQRTEAGYSSPWSSATYSLVDPKIFLGQRDRS